MLNGDICELFNTDISNYELGVVLDRYGKIFINKNYFNSGMLLMNIPKIKESNLLEKVRNLCVNKKMTFPDQDALNKLCKNKLYLPRKFNEQGNLKQDTIIQHFSKRFTLFPYFHTINIKPWQIDLVHSKLKNYAYDNIYQEYFSVKNLYDFI
jgi:lipopolysaccharide biosynthesis glycosyltransferase